MDNTWEPLAVGDIVILTDQTKNLIKGVLLGGVLVQVLSTHVVLYRHNLGFRTYKKEEVRWLHEADIPEKGVEIL
jgi:hypothetical protein